LKGNSRRREKKKKKNDVGAHVNSLLTGSRDFSNAVMEGGV
jgi:hypothetical protein